MDTPTLQLVLRHAEALAAPADPTPDGDLVRRFAGGDEAAFAELVRRHGPMVWAACRHLLPAHADAEDAFQVTFLALARSARAIRRAEAVGGWLHGVAVRAATKLKRAAARRHAREHRAAAGEADRSVPEGMWEALLAATHEEVRRLPGPLREAFVLCDLEGVRQPDAAARLGWAPGTLTGRLARARRVLLDRLTGRGLAPAVAVGLGVASAGGSVPAGLALKVASLIRPGGVVPPAVLNLLPGVSPMTRTWWTKWAAVAVLAAGGIGAVVYPNAQAQQGGGARGGGGQPGLGGQPVPEDPRPGLSRGAPGGLGGRGGDATGSATGGSAARPGWEYKYVEQVRDVALFKKTLADNGAAGWEYCDHLDLSARGAEPVYLLVFKRPTGGPSGVFGGGFGGGFPGGGFDRGGGPAPGGPPGFTPGPGSGGPGGPGGPPPGSGGARPGSGGPGGGGAPGGIPGGTGPAPGGRQGTGGGNPFGGGLGAGGKAAPPAVEHDFVVMRAKHARAADLAATLKEVFGRDTVSIVAEPSSNSVVVMGDARQIERVRALMAQLDTEAADARPAPPKR